MPNTIVNMYVCSGYFIENDEKVQKNLIAIEIKHCII